MGHNLFLSGGELAQVYRTYSETLKKALLFVHGFCFAIFFRSHYVYVFDLHGSSSAATSGSSVLLSLFIYEDLAMYIDKCCLINAREEPYELQFAKVSIEQFVSDYLKHNLFKKLKKSN